MAEKFKNSSIDKSYNFLYQNSKFSGVLFSGNPISLLTNDIGYVTSSAGSSVSTSSLFSNAAFTKPTLKLVKGDGSDLDINLSSLITGSNSFTGTQRIIFTTASIVYSGSNVTQVTQSFGSTQQLTKITYSGSFSNGDPLTIAVTGSDGVKKLYTLTYSASLITKIIQS